jgi:hypothetical protein
MSERGMHGLQRILCASEVALEIIDRRRRFRDR